MPTITLIIILGFAVISILPLLKEKKPNKVGLHKRHWHDDSRSAPHRFRNILSD